MTTLPVLDLRTFGSDEHSAAAALFVDELRAVCHGTGFFALGGHEVDPALSRSLHEQARRFFALPEAERLAIANVNSPQFRGYTPVGHEYTGGRPDRRDELDVGWELPAPVLRPEEPPWLRLRGPNLWPAAQPELRPVVTDWMTEMERVGRTLLRAVALALGQPADRFEPCVSPHPEVLVKVIRYPGCSVDALDDTQGVGAHRDSGLLAFVDQDATGGLQVLLDGAFVDVDPVPGTFVVNLGEMMQLLTHGYFTATVHRVVSPPPGRARISIAYFLNPKLEATLAPLTLPPGLAAHAPGGESADASNPILANYGENSMKVRLRAHPDVARRHHADLIAEP